MHKVVHGLERERTNVKSCKKTYMIKKKLNWYVFIRMWIFGFVINKGKSSKIIKHLTIMINGKALIKVLLAYQLT